MQLISYCPKINYPPFYKKRSTFARVDSLPYIFRKLRIHRNLTKRALAEKFGISEEYVSKIERGSVYPSLNFCLKCAKEFDANPNWVKNKWANGRVVRYREAILKRLNLGN